MRSEKPICDPPRLSAISPSLPLKRFQCSSDRRWPSRPFKGRSSSASSFHASLLQGTDGVMHLAFRPQVVSQAPQHFIYSDFLGYTGKNAACNNSNCLCTYLATSLLFNCHLSTKENRPVRREFRLGDLWRKQLKRWVGGGDVVSH